MEPLQNLIYKKFDLFIPFKIPFFLVFSLGNPNFVSGRKEPCIYQQKFF